MKRTRAIALATAAAILLPALAQAAGTAVPPPGYRPDMSTDEAGLWMQVDKAEEQIKTSPALITDPALNKYVQNLVCKLAGEHCGSIRVYVMQVPAFNAYMMPNGAMVVWSGLLLRSENESQLAFVLGHEITHYLHRHSLDQFRRIVNTAGAMVFVQLAAAGAGVGALGSLAQLAAVGGLLAHSRDQERDADMGGFTVTIAAGYDPGQAPIVWRHVADESAANPRRSRDMFFASHPLPEERLSNMQKQAKDAAPKRSDWALNADAYRQVTEPFVATWVADELARGEAEESIVVFSRLAGIDPSRGLYHYALGESFRKRNAKDDFAIAQNAYRAALACADAPPAAWRGLGLIAMRDGDKAAAKDSFTQYRAKAPDADDKAMIDFYLTQL